MKPGFDPITQAAVECQGKALFNWKLIILKNIKFYNINMLKVRVIFAITFSGVPGYQENMMKLDRWLGEAFLKKKNLYYKLNVIFGLFFF